MSVTKSVTSTLIGIAIQKGYIKDVRQPLLNLLPDQKAANLDAHKKAITLEDLLTMTSGLDCHENPAPGEPSMQASQDWVQFVLDLPTVAQPGTKFNYCTATIELLSAVLQKATGMSARKFANENLFAPIGIGPIEENRWPSDPQGITLGGYGLTLTPREMAKFGYLFLNQGQWDGKTIVPADWVANSTSCHSDKGDKKEYGYLWWIDPQGKWYTALGLGGQHIFIYPAENLVVVSTADLPLGNDADLLPIQELIDGYILPSVKLTKPLPANPDDLARLQAKIKVLGGPEITAPKPLPPIATQISGKTYTIGENPFGWETMIFGFLDGADEAKVTVNGTRQVTIGLDNAYRESRLDDKTFPQEFRGYWEGVDTFVVEDLVLGNGAIGYGAQLTLRFQFSGDTVHIIQQESHSPGSVELDGTLKPAAN
jgi:CubicO group peptidase (beta-lactamase class C family)